MPGIDGYEVCRRDPRRPGDRVPAGRDDHRRRASRRSGARSRPAPTTSSPSRSTRPSCSRACARCCGSSATTTRSRRFNRGLRRFLPPEVAELVKADPSVLESHRREIAVLVLRAARASPRSPSRAEPEDVMARAGLLPRRPRRADRRGRGRRSSRLTGDELLVVFNDPLPCEEPARRAVRLALALRDRVWELAEGWTGSASTSSSPAGRARPRHDRPDRLRAALGVRAGRHRADCSPSASAESAAPGRSWSRSGSSRPPSARDHAATGELHAARLRHPGRAFDVVGPKGVDPQLVLAEASFELKGSDPFSRRRRSRRRRTRLRRRRRSRRPRRRRPKKPAADRRRPRSRREPELRVAYRRCGRVGATRVGVAHAAQVGGASRRSRRRGRRRRRR